jgi:tetratricopeptide (TPR) repeat protein
MRKVLTLALLMASALAFAQEAKDTIKEPKPDSNLPKGNAQYNSGQFAQAEANYRISQSKSPEKAAASYNLGNAIYRQKQPAEAKNAYLNAIKNAKDKPQKHLAYHNLGNVLMGEKDYSGAVEAYKNALRNNPNDEETRYNYALAKSMLKNNPPPKNPKSPPPPPKPDPKSQPKPNQGGGQNQDQNKNQGNGNNDNKNHKDQGDKQNDKGKGDKNNNPPEKDKGNGQGDKKESKGDAEPSGGNPNKERMENMLDAMNNEEKKVQDKMNAKQVKSQPKKQEKDW